MARWQRRRLVAGSRRHHQARLVHPLREQLLLSAVQPEVFTPDHRGDKLRDPSLELAKRAVAFPAQDTRCVLEGCAGPLTPASWVSRYANPGRSSRAGRDPLQPPRPAMLLSADRFSTNPAGPAHVSRRAKR